MSWFAQILVHHPYIIISAVAVISGTCLIIPFTLKTLPFPNFQDPQMGFSTRGTTIANRLTAWANLVKSTKQPSGQFAVNPREMLAHINDTVQPKFRKKSSKKKKKPKKYIKGYVSEERNISDTQENDPLRALENLVKLNKDNYNPQASEEKDGFFCGIPDERYVQIVLKSSKDLFNIDVLLTICRLEEDFVTVPIYKDLCISTEKSVQNKCCRPWSLPNYIALLHNRTSCLGITETDVASTKTLIEDCSKYFYNFKLTANCMNKDYCGAPAECTQHDAVYIILNFLVGASLLFPSGTEVKQLEETMLFLPLATSTAMLEYYHTIEKLDVHYDNVEIVAMDMGIKNALFDEYLIEDAWLMASGAIFVFVCMWLYTESLFLTIMTIIAIIFSMGISYFMYIVVFEIRFFPFMNLLAAIVAIGIGADDAFIFCKIWHMQKKQATSSINKLMTDTFNHAFVSMFVTSLTTSVAFFASCVSSITAISCFSIFAGTAVVANYLLMITWFPACVVLWERSCCSNVALFKSCLMACLQRWCCSKIVKPQYNLSTSWFKCSLIHRIWHAKETFLLDIVLKLRCIWLVVLLLLAVVCGVIVLVYPKLQLPNYAEFQLFDSKHLFEQYDFKYKNVFWFKRQERVGDVMGSTTIASSAQVTNTLSVPLISNTASNYKLPLRFVWGILPVDNGDHLDPTNLGSLVLDPDFDMSQPEAQKWLLNFCEKLRQQPFYQSMMGPLLPNCFVETFMKSMQRKCYDSFTNKDRSPCCETASFPFNSSVFNECIIEEMSDIYETPSQYLIPGMAGPKFSKGQNPTIKAVIVEYDSTFSYSLSFEHMNEFFTQVESWMQRQLETAPNSMKNGWFVSELDFYDLQRELTQSTQIAIAMSMGLALVVLLISTLNVLISLYAILTITCTIFVAMAILVLLGWKLNILESIAVSTAIGLAVDFSLHYSVNYRLCPEQLKEDRIAATRYALSHMAGPALMAAITTGAAGAFMLPSMILPYIQIGIFLVIIMTVSWLYATFFLGSILAIAGPERHFGQLTYSKIVCCPYHKAKMSFKDRNRNSSNRPLSTTSTTTTTVNQDTHELEALTHSKVSARGGCGGSSTTPPPPNKLNSSKFNPSRISKSSAFYTATPTTTTTDQSPSATSAITIIMVDDNY